MFSIQRAVRRSFTAQSNKNSYYRAFDKGILFCAISWRAPVCYCKWSASRCFTGTLTAMWVVSDQRLPPRVILSALWNLWWTGRVVNTLEHETDINTIATFGVISYKKRMFMFFNYYVLAVEAKCMKCLLWEFMNMSITNVLLRMSKR
jgi:hypothetical protein